MRGYTNILGYEPEPGAIFVVAENYKGKAITRRFQPAKENYHDFPRNYQGIDYSDAAGNFFAGSGIEYLIRYDGGRWRKL